MFHKSLATFCVCVQAFCITDYNNSGFVWVFLGEGSVSGVCFIFPQQVYLALNFHSLFVQ